MGTDDDYTPTTEAVRYAYAMHNDYTDFSYNNGNHVAEFDRWLNAERARIWAEGFDAGANHDLGDWEVAPEPIVNPYKVDA